MKNAYYLALVFIATACGAVHMGSSNNDQVPSGTILAQGNFNAQVSGLAVVYKTGADSYVTRLQNLTVPSASNLLVITVNNGQAVNTVALRGLTGNQNYSFTANVSGNFNQVRIYSPSLNSDVGTAALIQQ